MTSQWIAKPFRNVGSLTRECRRGRGERMQQLLDDEIDGLQSKSISEVFQDLFGGRVIQHITDIYQQQMKQFGEQIGKIEHKYGSDDDEDDAHELDLQKSLRSMEKEVSLEQTNAEEGDRDHEPEECSIEGEGESEPCSSASQSSSSTTEPPQKRRRTIGYGKSSLYTPFFQRKDASSSIYYCLMKPDAYAKEKGSIHQETIKAKRTDKLHTHLSVWHTKALNEYLMLREDDPNTSCEVHAQTIMKKYQTSPSGIDRYCVPVKDLLEKSRQATIRRHMNLLFFLASRNLPLAAVEDEYFIHYHNMFGVKLPPSRREITSFISIVATAIQKLIDQYLKTLPAFSITTDAWTDATLRKYVSITYHAIDPISFTLLSLPRDVIFVPTSHTWWEVANVVRRTINSHFPGSSLLSTVTTDNGANFIKMSIALLSTLDEEEIGNLLPNSWDTQVEVPKDHEDKGWRCVDHTMHLAVLDVLDLTRGCAQKDVLLLIDSVRKISAYIRKSPNIRQSLIVIQRATNSKILIPKIDEPTRWCTIYYMLERFEVISLNVQYLAALGIFNGTDLSIPTFQEMQIIRLLLKILEPIAKFVRLCEGEKYITISKIPQYLKDVHLILDQFTDDTAVKLKEAIDRRLGYILSQPNYSLFAAALDPSVFLSEIVSPRLNDEIWELLEVQVLEYAELTTTEEPDDLNPNLSQYSLQEIHFLLASYRKIFEDPTKRDRLQSKDPLIYWKSQFSQSPQSCVLRSIVLCLFCICATSASSERLFSQCGRVLTKTRCRMLPSLLDHLILIKGFLNSSLFDVEKLFEIICQHYVPE